ncbi:MAG: ABC transporter substrate-binding protein [Burkholderiaceae bacterium]|nr:MAG: ABC transporter substrate-binding protein [Burkholderiaceae bacterium]
MKKLILNLVFGAGIALAMISVTASAATVGLESITYLLPAPKTTPGFAPWLIAQEEGYFREVGLDVSFLSTRGGVEVAKQIGAGNALIGGGMGDTSVIVRANGVPVKAVALLGAGTLTFIASLEKDPVDTPAQLRGRTITVISYADTVYYSLLATLKKAGLTRDDVTIC